ncbi:hypothetical protein [Candidatus Methylacidithermus pantelleriae]|nr:hypothetical protein [Candidatus Methylacidithermus pantelleriae]
MTLWSAVPEGVQRGQYTVGALEVTYPVPLPVQTENSLFSVGPYPTVLPDLPSFPGKNLVVSYCSGCHTTQYLLMQPKLSPEGWKKIVAKMEVSFGAPVPKKAEGPILTYLEQLSEQRGPTSGNR